MCKIMEGRERNLKFFHRRWWCGISRRRGKEEANTIVYKGGQHGQKLRERDHMTYLRIPQECNMVAFVGSGRRWSSEGRGTI